jgi:hypothetical protein
VVIGSHEDEIALVDPPRMRFAQIDDLERNTARGRGASDRLYIDFREAQEREAPTESIQEARKRLGARTPGQEVGSKRSIS